MPMDHKRPVDMKQVIARIPTTRLSFLSRVPASTTAAPPSAAATSGSKSGKSSSPNTARSIRGATKAITSSRPLSRLAQPILYLNNTTGFMVVRRLREAALKRRLENDPGGDQCHCAADHDLCGGSSFAPALGHGRGSGFHRASASAWPIRQTAVRVERQAARTMAIVQPRLDERKGEVDQASWMTCGSHHRPLRTADERVS